MKKTTPQHLTSFVKFIFTIALALTLSPTQAQSVMYGDTIFWENFGTGTTRADLSGRGTVGGLYLYAGDLKYAIALEPSLVSDYVTGAGKSEEWILETPRFKEIPLSTDSNPYQNKPSAGASAPYNGYWTITSWKDWTFSSKATDYTTATKPVATYTAGAENDYNNYPCSWVKINNVWKFGFYYATFTYDETERVPNDGYYALINDGDSLTGADNYLQDHWLDHSGWSNLTENPLTPATTLATHTGNGRFMFVNCSQSGAITGAVYKRLVTELCRDAMFEFSVWVASIHGTNSNSVFRIEIWSADPGENPSLGGITTTGTPIDVANNATLLAVSAKDTIATVGFWERVDKVFTLTGQDYCWVVVRNYGTGGGNDIAIDDLVFKPYAPFNLNVQLGLSSTTTACADGLVTLISKFPTEMPAYIDITQFGFFFQGEKNGTWERIGSSIPIQTQSADEPLELTFPLAEYNSYARFRVIVATTPAGFGGRCITFTYPPVSKESISASPAFTLEGDDVCEDLSAGPQYGKFIIRNTNQSSCDGWQVKVRMPDGTISTLTPASKGSCE